jgi:CBS domain-containing protein
VQFSFPLLSALQVRDAMTPPRAPITTDATVRQAHAVLQAQGSAGLAVVDARHRFVGLVTRDGLRRAEERDGESAPVGPLASATIEPLSPVDALDTALEQLAERALPWLPVVAEGRVVGGLSARDALRTYKARLGRSIRRTQRLPEQTSVFEDTLGADSPPVRRTLRGAGLPKQTLVLAIVRDAETLFPSAGTELLPGDVLMLMASAAAEEQLKAFLEPTAAIIDARG